MNRERMYNVILSPVITEKSTLGSEHNQVTFKVAKDATKPEVKTAIEDAVRRQGQGGQHPEPEG